MSGRDRRTGATTPGAGRRNVIVVVHSDELAARYTRTSSSSGRRESVESQASWSRTPSASATRRCAPGSRRGTARRSPTRIAHRIAKAKKAHSDLLARGDVRAGPRRPRRSCLGRQMRCGGRRRRHPDEGRLPPVGAERELGVEDARDQTASSRTALHREELDALRPGRCPRLHARQGRGRRRLPLHRELQPLPFGRAERRERPRGQRSRRCADQLAAFVDEIHALYPSAPIP